MSLHFENLIDILIGLLEYWIQVRKWISVAKLNEVDLELGEIAEILPGFMQ